MGVVCRFGDGAVAVKYTILILVGACLLSACEKRDVPAEVGGPPGSVLWTYEVGAELWAPLELEGGVLYFGDDSGTFRPLDVTTREPLWEFSAGGRIRSGAEIVNGTVLFASDDGSLYALDRQGGDELWRFDLGSSGLERRLPATEPPYEYDYLHSSPTHDDGVVYVGSADGDLYAVDLETGQERWRFAAAERVRSSPTVAGATVYFGSWDGHVYAVSTATGDEVWRFDTQGPVQGTPAVGDGRVIVGSRSSRVFGLNAESGAVEWTLVHEDGSWVESSPVLADGVVYIGSSDALKLFALEASSGRELWHFKTGGWTWSTPAVAGHSVYIGGISAFPYYFEGVDLEAGLYAVDRRTGEERWRLTPEPIEGYVTGGVFSTPVIADAVVYVGGLDGTVYAITE
jgi:outer membrane protein assembly factor BamB